MSYHSDSVAERARTAPHNLQPSSFFYIPLYAGSSEAATVACDVKSTYMESFIRCYKPHADVYSKGCFVHKVRTFHLEHPPTSWTYMDLDKTYWPALLEILSPVSAENIESQLCSAATWHMARADSISIRPVTNHISSEEYSIYLG